MVTVTGHGGGCCGANHIYGFRGNENDDIRELETILENGTISYMYEVILSELQCRSKPNLLQRLNELGFVLTDRWRGNHGTPVNRFSRARQRLPLVGDTTTYRWNGMFAGPLLGGVMGNGTFGVARGDGIAVGSQCRINNTRSRDYGRTVTISGRRQCYERGTLLQYRDRENTIRELVPGSFTPINVAAPAPIEPLRHPTIDAPVAGQPAPAPPTAVATLYRNVFADGREGALYDTLEACNASAPRCRRKQRVQIMSDGTRNVTGGEGANPFPM